MSDQHRIRIAIEGPVCAGKTTLSDNLVRAYSEHRLCVIPDYSDFVGGGRNLPNPLPANTEDELDALDRFRQLERDRFEQYSRATQICVIDRSIHTLLAHCIGVEFHCGRSWFDPALQRLQAADEMVWPDLIIYLDIPLSTILERNRGKFPDTSLFTDERFNAGFRDYFIPTLRVGRTGVRVVDGTISPNEVCLQACEAINAVL